MPDVNAVIFDIGNVLIEWQPERFFDSVIGPDRRRAMFDAIDLHAMNDAVDRGAHFTQTVHAMAHANPAWRDEVLMWHDRWIDMASPAIDHSVRLLRALRENGVPVFALTNFGIQTFAIAEPVYPFLGEFDRRYISGHMGVIKPETRIYEMVEQDCGLDPSSLLFADDRIDNIYIAADRGWQTHLFDGPQGWADRLVDAGLLTQEAAQ
ncbi:HAD family hydrolase [Yoonia sp.]|uniref:HAD family hydrolase n=1 Tax=Yoonia sp. TaxID=2212373 RepID=UPI003F6BAB9E